MARERFVARSDENRAFINEKVDDFFSSQQWNLNVPGSSDAEAAELLLIWKRATR